jgi:excisionase family DNA binding protein
MKAEADYLKEPLLSCAEVARRVSAIGARPTNPSTVFRWCRSGRMASVKIGRRLRIPESAVERFIQESTDEWRSKIDIQRSGEPSSSPMKRQAEVDEAMRLLSCPSRRRAER